MVYEAQNVKTQPSRRALTAGSRRNEFGLTTVQDTYKWPKIVRESVKCKTPNNQTSHAGLTGYTDTTTMFSKTTYADDYIRFPGHVSHLPRNVSGYFLNDRNIQREVKNWRSNYEETNQLLEVRRKEKGFERAAMIRPPEDWFRSGIFEGQSVYQESFFPQRADCEVYPRRPKKVKLTPFRGTSTMRSDYVDLGVDPEPHPPRLKGKLSPESRDFSTTYRDVHRKLPTPELSSSPTFMRHWNYMRRHANVNTL